VSIALLSVVLTIVPGIPARADYQVIHSFTDSNNGTDGGVPLGSLTQSGSTLYGMTVGGGVNYGCIFQVGVDGTGFNVMHSFAQNGGDGGTPEYGSLIQSGSTLYGMNSRGGNGNGDGGTIFKIGADGGGYSVLHSFGAFQGDASSPQNSLIQSGSTLYGMTNGGGIDLHGCVFSVGVDGTGFNVLHSFSGGSDGRNPFGSLIQSGSTLYGMTTTPGADGNDRATIFKIGTDGTGYSILHTFTNQLTNGNRPFGSLIQSGSTLYGMTLLGGSADQGTVFKIGSDGSGFSLLHSFTGGTNDGAGPFGSLIKSGSSLYGMTNDGGISNQGTIFRIADDGTDFRVLHAFAGASGDGRDPHGSLILSGSVVYGMTSRGGSSDMGTIFSLTVPEPSTLVLAMAGMIALVGYGKARNLYRWRKPPTTRRK